MAYYQQSNNVMRIFDIIYYQAFLFYSKRLKEDDPHFTTTWGVGIAFAFILTFPFFTFLQILFCIRIRAIFMFLSGILIVVPFFYYFNKNNKKYQVLKNKPLYKASKNKSIVITVVFFAAAILMLFICPVLGAHFKKINCG
jgi:archaellum biogenesis protein FlaJ (TadC family)